MSVVKVVRVLRKDKVDVCKMTEKSFRWGDYINDVFDDWVKNGVFLKAVENDKIVGIIHVKVFKDFVWFEGLRVHKDYRRKGIGRLLTTKAMEISDGKTIRLLIHEHNKPSMALSTSLGFRQIDKIYYHSGREREFSKVVETLKLKKVKVDLQKGYMDGWTWHPKEHYKNPVYSGIVRGKRIVALETKPLFLIEGSMGSMAYVSHNKDAGSGFIVFELDKSKHNVQNTKL